MGFTDLRSPSFLRFQDEILLSSGSLCNTSEALGSIPSNAKPRSSLQQRVVHRDIVLFTKPLGKWGTWIQFVPAQT